MTTTVETTAENSSNTRIRKESTKSKIIVNRVYYGDYQKEGDGKQTAELKQKVTQTAYYPTKQISSNLQGNIYKAEDFGFEEKPFINETVRVAWIDVPEGSTIESVQKDLEKFPDSVLYRVLANKPVLTDNQKFAVDNPQYNATMDSYANKQIVRERSEEEGVLGKIALFNGKVQYKANFFWPGKKEDIDWRTADPQDMFMSEDIKAELNHAYILQGQKI